MAYDEQLVDRIRDELGDRPGIIEKKMFGGLSFLLDGNMAVGVMGDELCVRVGADAHEEAMFEPGTRIFDFTGRPMEGWIMVAPEGVALKGALAGWIERGVGFASMLPAK